MANTAFVNHLAAAMEVPEGSLQAEDKLADLEGWTSIAMVSFIAMADEHYGKSLSPRLFAHCETVADLAKLVGAAD